MHLDLFSDGALIGSVVRGGTPCVYAYDPSRLPIGTFADIDAAAAALAYRRVAA
ncbi:hypothetical protein [Methylobacterium radiotolerans]|uniref:hypothetical protein n=1 Tax=Methylobacterium radiotolerans TaxID=31998 RepID=UPI000D5DF590|nr:MULTISPECIES: hypothetical protein [Methylobacterium]MDE3748623.1 hypothetical protein [Methylobacterium radiotolerans]PVZ05028.1 hypothetical protein C7388_10520 [Methylobacterium organophilum]